VFGLKDISISFLTGSPVWVWIGLLGLLGLSWLLYWRTNPPLPRYLRVGLGMVRVMAVLALVAALSEPVLSYSRQFERPRRLAVLIDRSASMDREEQGLTRRARVDSLLASEAMARLLSASDIETYYFGGNLTENAAEVLSAETALGSVLHDLERRQLSQKYDHWVLFTDGRNNSGPRPIEVARNLPTPVTSVGMATGGDYVDVAIAEVNHNAVVFAGRSTEVAIKLQWDRAEGQALQVRLLDSGRVLAENRLDIDQENGYADMVLSYVPGRPGQRLLSVQVTTLQGESDTNNNSRTISVKVLSSRVSILLVTGHPDYEAGFLHRFLQQSDRYEVELVATGGKSGRLSGRFPGDQSELNRYDLIVFHDPDPARLATYRNQLRSYLSDRGGGLWLLMGRNFASRMVPTWLSDLLPFHPTGPVEVVYSSFHGAPAEGQLFHPAVRLADNRADIRDTWANLPPFKSLVPCRQLGAESVVLAYATGLGEAGERLPVLGFRRVGPGKVLASAALPLWTWGFVNLGYGVDNSSYANLMEGAVNWLTVQDDFDPIRIAPEKEIFSRSEPIRFKGLAFDQGFRPIPDVDGTVALSKTGSDDKFETDLLDRGEGEYVGEFGNLPPGEYTYTASFSKEGQVLRTNQGRLLIESFSLEEYDQRGDPATLAALAQATGGQFFDFTDLTSAVSSIDLRPVAETVSREVTVWGKLWLLLIFVGALALEWVLRKLNHLL